MSDRWAAMRFEMGGVPVIRRDDLRVEDDPEHDLDGPDPFAPDSLDAAWAEAEAALPEGWHIAEVLNTSYRIASMGDGERWMAMASVADEARSFVADYGPTPAAALRALAAKLRERQP